MGCAGDGEEELSAEAVRRRMAWARRQGRPAWLWPDLPIEAWRAALGQIEAATIGVLADRPTALNGDPAAIGLAGYTSGMGPLVGYWIEQGRLTADGALAAMLARRLAHNRARATRMAAAATKLVEQLAGQGVEVLMLKGAHTAPAYFPETGVRPASDIDLLVRPSDVAGAEAALEGAGLSLKSRARWESSWHEPSSGTEPKSLTYVHADDPWSVDLHGSLNIAVGRAAPVAELDRVEPMASRSRWPLNPRAGALDQPLLLLHLAAHAGAGWHSLTLLRQVELVMVIRKDAAEGRLSWEAFLGAGAATGALGYAYPALRLCEILAPGAVPARVLDRSAADAPQGVRRAIARLTPATAQRIERNSLAEHFMWTPGWRGRLRQLTSDILPGAVSWPELAGIYEERAWRLIRGRVSQ